jgi:hypothetical protein
MIGPHRLGIPMVVAVVGLSSLTECAGGGADQAAPADGGSASVRAQESLKGMLDGPEGRDDPLWYEPLRGMDCADDHLVASRGQAIPMAGYLLCQAVATGDEVLWSQGAQALAQAPAPKNCWEQEAVSVLQRLVEAHEEQPEVTFRVEEQPGYACELVLDSLGSPLVPGVVASELPVSLCGGAPVFLHGNVEFVEEGTIQTVRVGEKTATVQEGNGGLFFRAPATDVPGVVAVSVLESTWPVRSETSLNYQEPAGPCPTVPPPVTTQPSTSDAG